MQDLELRPEQRPQLSGGVTGTQVAVPFVGEPDPQAQSPQKGRSLVVRHIEDGQARRLQDPVDFANESPIVRDVFKHVGHHDAIEDRVRVREVLPVDLCDVGFHHVVNGLNRFDIEISAAPLTAPSAEKITDDAVVTAQVQPARHRDSSQGVSNRAPFRLLQGGLGKEGQIPPNQSVAVHRGHSRNGPGGCK
jgi:hypothetical protein